MDDQLSTKQIKEIVDLIVDFKNTAKLKKLKSKSIDEYNQILENTFPSFKLNYPGIFDIVVNNDNLDMLYNMFKMKEQIDNGGDKDKIEKDLGEILAQKYVYPHINK